MSHDYFEIAGVLFAAYCVIRFIIWTELRLNTQPDTPSKPYDGPIKSLDTTVLSHRLQNVRRDYHVEKPAQSDSLKQSLLVRSRREEIAKLAFFQKPPPEPPPEPPEHDHGWNVLVV